MHGNVREWVQDAWHDNYLGAPDDGSAWLSGGNPSRRVLRGGARSYAPQFLRSARRDWDAPSVQVESTGFRIARTF